MAFIGAGQIAWDCAPTIHDNPRAALVAAHDTNPERLAALCKEREIPRAYATAEELFADRSIDAVYIATPNKFHVPLAIQALEAGKHVLLEKPFAMNFAEAQLAADTARRVGRVLTVGMNRRFVPEHQQVRAMVEAGMLGEIYHAKAFWFRRSGIPKLGTWFGSRELAGRGCLGDIGVHQLDLCLYLMGNFQPVSAVGATYTKFGHLGRGEGGWGKSDRAEIPFDVEDFATGLVRFANGATVSLDVSWACHSEEASREDVHLYGTEAGAQASHGKLFRRDAASGEYRIEQNVCAKVPFPDTNRFNNFINHILDGEELCVTLDQALTVQRILDAVAESAATGKQVTFD